VLFVWNCVSFAYTSQSFRGGSAHTWGQAVIIGVVDCEGEGTTFLSNAENQSPNMAPHPTGLKSPQSAPHSEYF
jgi:hypothetical protein